MASYTQDTFVPDRLIAGCPDDIITEQITLKSGQNLVRGAVLGKTVTDGTIAGAAVAGNTGNGTIGSLTIGGAAKQGVYRLICIEPGTNSGKFTVEDPAGIVIGVATVAVAFSAAIGFTIADGATDFVSGDSFTVTVSDITEKLALSAATATDGTQHPDCVLVEDTDASDGDVLTIAYIAGSFNDRAITLGAGHTVDSVKEQLRAKNIYLIQTGAA